MPHDRSTAKPNEARRRALKRPAAWLSAHAPIVAAVLVVALVVVVALAGYYDARRTNVAADDRAEMARADAAIDSLRHLAWRDEHAAPNATPTLDDEGLLTLAYVARVELGVGSPFRIAAFAARDPRLSAAMGRTAAWGVLARAARGTSHLVDSTDLRDDRSRAPVSAQWRAIEHAIATAHDARTGEAAVRLGYTLAASEGSVTNGAIAPALRVAAQLRDRRLTTEDARHLLRVSAAQRETDALTLVPQWRAERRFAVEQPLLGPGARVDDPAAVRGALVLRDALRAAQTDTTTRDTTSAIAPAPARVDRLLPPRAARRLAELTTVRDGAPQAPIAVATAAYRRQLVRIGSSDTLASRLRFAERARSEESLVAELAVAATDEDGLPSDVASVGLAAAVAMRAFAQDTIVPVAPQAPTIDAMRTKFGVRSVTFDRSVPSAWRPYYLAQLATALEDLQTVLPGLEFDGLAIRVGESVKRDSALALHDPASRTVFLPAATGAGTIAHELAHDLDWQTARNRLALWGAYSTDRAVRDGRGSLAVSMRGLAAARPRSAGMRGDTTAERPAELFARGVDWYVATALAALGRSDGALSAVQDEVLAGYAGVVPPDAGDGAADALVAALSDMTVVPAATRAQFLSRYGIEGAEAPGARALLRAVSVTTSHTGPDRFLRRLDLIGEACPGTVDARDVTDGNWRAMLLRAGAESRARGWLRMRDSWNAPRNPARADTLVARMRDGLLRNVAMDEATHRPFNGGVLSSLAETRCR